MVQDIRNLFKEMNALEEAIPKNHEARFLKKT